MSSEDAPQIIKESIACNSPVLLFAVGDISEVAREIGGCCIDPRDKLKISQVIAHVASDNKRIDGIGYFPLSGIVKDVYKVCRSTYSVNHVAKFI